MNFKYRFLALLTCILVVIDFPIQPTVAQTETQIENIANRISVQIVTPSATNPNKFVSRGSGVLIRKEGTGYSGETEYYVITNLHVVDDSRSYRIRIPGYSTNVYTARIIDKSPNIDLALLSFISSNNYPVAQRGDAIGLSSRVYVAGWTSLGEDYRWDFASGIITNNFDSNLNYNNRTYPGMSGGPVLDQDGLLVGIHKAKERGISINSIRQFLNEPSFNESFPPSVNDNLPFCSEVFFGACRE